jgi:hypothetical protein
MKKENTTGHYMYPHQSIHGKQGPPGLNRIYLVAMNMILFTNTFSLYKVAQLN